MIPAADIYLYLIFLTLLFIAITLWRMYNIMRKDKSITISKGLSPIDKDAFWNLSDELIKKGDPIISDPVEALKKFDIKKKDDDTSNPNSL